MKKIFAIVLVLVVILVGCSSGVSQAEYDKVVSERDALRERIESIEGAKVAENESQTEDETLSPETIKITAAELIAAYENVVKGDNDFKNKLIEVTGVVKGVAVNQYQNNAVYVKLSPGEKFDIDYIECYFQDKAEIEKVGKLDPGDEITIIAVGGGKGVVNVILVDCMIV